jgi:hypothetical protein
MIAAALLGAQSADAETTLTPQTGYAKAYRYDDRLRAEKPPFFPDSRVTGYVLFTNFEIMDPEGEGGTAGCPGRYRSEWEGRFNCTSVWYATGDRVEGPFHTNDTAAIVGSPEFGRAGADPPDAVEIVGGARTDAGAAGPCAGAAVFHTASGCYVRGEKIPLPENVTALAGSAEAEGSFAGETRLELDGSTNTIRVTGVTAAGNAEPPRTVSWPKNGLIYVHATSCGWHSTMASDTDAPGETKGEAGCGDVYVRGTYSRPLTIVAQEDLIIDGSVYPTTVAERLGASPSGESMLGLVAGDHVRVYHPCSGENVSASADPNGWGSQPNIWIYASILAVSHSFFVDNAQCGAGLGDLNIYGSLAENYHGIVGTVGGGASAAPPAEPAPVPCTSKRSFVVHVARVRGAETRRVTVRLNGHRLKPRLTKHGVTVAVDLRGRPKGTYVLRITVETARGRKITGTRTYHTCAATPLRPRRQALL